jgi:surfeit locus 1 family protein
MASATAMEFRKVRVTGRFEQERQLFIENRKYQGRNGYHVVTPLILNNSEVRVLVNRGWVPSAEDLSVLPEVATPAKTIGVSGVIDIPSPPALALTEETAPLSGPVRWPYLTVERFGAAVDYPVQPFVILQSPQDDHGFVRAWPKRKPNDAMHIGYAIQWFAFAAIALIIYLRLCVSRQHQGVDR